MEVLYLTTMTTNWVQVDMGQAAGNSTANISDNSLVQDLSSDGSFRIDGQRLYNLALHTDRLRCSLYSD